MKLQKILGFILEILCTICFIVFLGLFIFMFTKIFPSKRSVNKIIQEIEKNQNVEKIEYYFQDDERSEDIYADIQLKNKLHMSFNYIKWGKNGLVFQDLRKINGFVPMAYIYKKSEEICIIDEFCTQYLYSTHNLTDWLENSEAIYDKIQKLPIIEIRYDKSKEFFDSLQTDFVEETDTEIRKYFKWKRK